MVEKEYIERGALIADLAKLEREYLYADGSDLYPFVYGTLTGVRQSTTRARTVPAADVVEVVRCKDCQMWTGKDYDGCCIANGLATRMANDFCSCGVKKEQT